MNTQFHLIKLLFSRISINRLVDDDKDDMYTYSCSKLNTHLHPPYITCLRVYISKHTQTHIHTINWWYLKINYTLVAYAGHRIEEPRLMVAQHQRVCVEFSELYGIFTFCSVCFMRTFIHNTGKGICMYVHFNHLAWSCVMHGCVH